MKLKLRMPRLRFSLRTLFVMVTVLCVCATLGLNLYRAERQKAAVKRVQAIGGRCLYDIGPAIADQQRKAISPNNLKIPDASPWPAWMVRLFGIDFFHNVNEVQFSPGRLTKYRAYSDDLSHLAEFPKLRSLRIRAFQETDKVLRFVGQLHQLEHLELALYQVSDVNLRHLAGLTRLRSLSVSNRDMTDESLRTIGQLTQLTHLDLDFHSCTNDGLAHLANLTRLENLCIGPTPRLPRIDDRGLAHLKTLVNLKRLDISGCQVTPAGVEQLQSLPNLTRVLVQPRDPTDLDAMRDALPNVKVD